jgi:hypothetical protein
MKFIKRFLIFSLMVILGYSCGAALNLPGESSETTYSVSGVVNGLANGEVVVLQNNRTDDLTTIGSGVSSDPFEFSTLLSTGESYDITVLTEPFTKHCIVGANSGTVSSTNISNVLVTCSAVVTFTTGGNVTNLLGTGLVLKNTINGITLDFFAPNPFAASYAFPATLGSGDTFDVTIQSQPVNPVQSCSVVNSAGTMGSSNIGNVDISCNTGRFSVKGVISGVAVGETIEINDGNNPLVITNSPYQEFISFSFPLVDDLTSYNVTVTTTPAGKTCSVTNPGGVPLSGSDVTNVFITCSTAGLLVVRGLGGGSGISGLANNSTIILDLNSTVGIAETLPVTNTTGAASLNLSYTFLNTFANGADVTVSITNPASPSQTCTPASLGPVTLAGTVTLPEITCVTNKFFISGNVSGLTPGDVLTVSMASTTNGISNPVQTFDINPATGALMPFNMAAGIDDGSSYSIWISAFTPTGANLTCGVPSTGVLSGADITVTLTCTSVGAAPVTVQINNLDLPQTALDYPLGLRLNGDLASDIEVNGSSGSIFTSQFSTPFLITGDFYSVSIFRQPTRAKGNSIDQNCYLSPNASGILTAGGVIVNVFCDPVAYPITGTITGLALDEETVIYNDTINAGQIVIGGGTGTDSYNLPSMNDGNAYNLRLMNSPNGKKCIFSSTSLKSISSTVSGPTVVEDVVCGPLPPAGISAASGNSQTTITWTNSPLNTYNIYWNTVPGITIGGAGVTKITGATTPYVHGALTNGTSYYYRLSAVNSGAEGELSAEFSTMPLAPLGVSEGSAISPLLIVSPHNGGIVGGINSYYRVNGLTPGGNYIFHLENLSGNANLNIYTDLFSTIECISDNGTSTPPTTTDMCVANTPPTGSLFIAVSGAGTLTYTLTGSAWPPSPFTGITVQGTYNPVNYSAIDVATGPVWVAFNVTVANQYSVFWDDSFNGSGSFNADVGVSGYDSLGNLLTVVSSTEGLGNFGSKIANSIDSGYNTPSVFTATATETIYLRVNPFAGTGMVGIQVTSP